MKHKRIADWYRQGDHWCSPQPMADRGQVRAIKFRDGAILDTRTGEFEKMTTKQWFQVCGACSAGAGLVLMCALAMTFGAELQRMHLWPW